MKNKEYFDSTTEALDFKRMHKTAVEKLRGEAIDPVDFSDDFGAEEIVKDQKYVKKMEDIFEREKNREKEVAEQLAQILEAILLDEIELNSWLGDNVTTIKTSRFDDIANGVDLIAEFEMEEEEKHHLGLAVDATLAHDINKKIKTIKEEILNGKLALIKYFKPGTPSLKDIARVIICADAETIKEVGEAWLEGKNKELAKHKIQLQILEELIMQLEVFSKFAAKHNKKDLVIIYEENLKLLKKIYDKKVTEIEDDGIRDTMFYYLERLLKHFDDEK